MMSEGAELVDRLASDGSAESLRDALTVALLVVHLGRYQTRHKANRYS